MADVPGKFYRATKVRTGVAPSSAGSIEGEVLPPVNPPGSSLNSVGLTMPSAFTVSNSPLTANGTIGVTGAGTVAQYIRGDGSLADFPESSGGGSSVSYYLNGSVNQGTIGGVAYKELSKVPILGAGTDFTINADGYIASFITDAGDPNLLEIPGGNWNFETYFSASSSGGTPTFYVELYKVSGTTATLIASSSSAPELIAFGTNLTPYFSTLAVPTTTLALTDRLAVRYYVTHSGRTITLHTENNHLCQIITTFTTGLTALNGLTAQVQNFAVGTTGTDFNISSATATHTFNLPTASATNRGALSSADWSLFTQAYNDKINSAAVTGTTTKTLTLTQQDGGTITASWSDLNTDAVLSVFGRTGAVVAANGDYTTAQVTESGNLYYTDARSRAALSFAAGSGAYNTSTGVITIPTNNNQITNGAGYITSAALAGYLPLIGGTMTGDINWGQTDRGLTWLFNTDGASIKFYNTGDGDTNSRLEFATLDNNNEYFRWVHVPSGGTTYESMRLVPNSSGNAQLIVSGSIIKQGGTSSQYLMADGSVSTLTNAVTGTGTTNYLPKFTGSTTIGDSALLDNNVIVSITNREFRIIDNEPQIYLTKTGTDAGIWRILGSTGGTTRRFRIYDETASADRLNITSGGNVLINSTSDNGARLQVSGEGRFYQPLTNTTSYLTVENNRARNAAIRLKTTVGDFYLGTGIGADVNQFQIFDGTAGANRLTISSTGAATFSSNVTTTGGFLQFPNNYGVEGRNAANTAYRTVLKLNTTNQIEIGRDTDISSIILGTASAVNAMTITSSGNVGIGLTPNASYGTLQIKAPSGVYSLDLVGRTAGLNGESQISFWNAAQSSVLAYITNTGSNLYLGTGANQPFTLSSGGNFIFGTTSDNGSRLQVSGNARFTRANDSGSILRLESVGNNGFDFSRNQSNGALQIQGNQTGFNNIVLAPTSGNVGIGTPSPTSGKLEIQTSSTTSALWVQTGGTTSSFTIADFRTGTNLPALQILGNGVSYFGGNVGIGTNSPLTRLDCQIATTGTLTENAAFRDSSTNGNALQIWNGNNEARLRAVYYGTPSNQSITFWTIRDNGSQGERMRIDHIGNILFKGQSTTTNAEGIFQNLDSRLAFFASNTITVSKDISFFSSLINNEERLRLTSTGNILMAPWLAGNVLIRTSTDTGDTLRVNGNTFSNTIMTWNPENDNRSGVAWRFGAKSDTIYTSNKSLRVNVGGVEYWILAREV